MNNINIIGNLTNHPELHLIGQSELAKFTIAYNKKIKDKKETYFFNCELWGGLVKVVKRYVGKGTKIAITGELAQSSWTDKESGKKRVKDYIRVKDINILTWKNEDSNEENQGENKSYY